MNSAQFKQLCRLLDRLAAGIEALAPTTAPPVDWSCCAFRWTNLQGHACLHGVHQPSCVDLTDLLAMETQKSTLMGNTMQFVRGLPANNVLLWGARGTGKSSLIKAMLKEFQSSGLRLIEVDKSHLLDLPLILNSIHARPEKFILFCDDLSFSAQEMDYKALKAVVDGSLLSTADKVLIYATSNRRHLLPESMEENLQARVVSGELHLADVSEEKLSLAERFGLQLSFPPLNQPQYLSIVAHWLAKLLPESWSHPTYEAEALRWALQRGSRSGRSAWQFAKHWAGQRLSK